MNMGLNELSLVKGNSWSVHHQPAPKYFILEREMERGDLNARRHKLQLCCSLWPKSGHRTTKTVSHRNVRVRINVEPGRCPCWPGPPKLRSMHCVGMYVFAYRKRTRLRRHRSFSIHMAAFRMFCPGGAGEAQVSKRSLALTVIAEDRRPLGGHYRIWHRADSVCIERGEIEREMSSVSFSTIQQQQQQPVASSCSNR